jgi:hypothetical protein
MSFWLREVAGWCLLLVSLVMIWMTYVFCERRWILEACPWTVLSIFVFRGSIHLLKVAVAARICQQAQNRLYPAADPAAPRRVVQPALTRKQTGLAER